MYTVEICFQIIDVNTEGMEGSVEAIKEFLNGLRFNGQILGREYPIARNIDKYQIYVLTPEENSLDKDRYNKNVRHWINILVNNGVTGPDITIIGKDPDSSDTCSCNKPGSYILYTTYLSLESPLSCGDCFLPVPLYRIPPTVRDGYYDIIVWQSNYQSCDTLWMNDNVAIRCAYRELSQANSSLSQEGRTICKTIFSLTGIPTYYYLYRHTGRNLEQEKARKCPSCGSNWLLEEPWHNMFDFKCEQCKLLSNIALNIR
ncbi:MAG: Zn-ribbon-containing protein [Herpetosiphonaceae bacterium]|nr:MAG: Zn-ribbon-containing protein [Herpetosiphonaceae bacterium]